MSWVAASTSPTASSLISYTFMSHLSRSDLSDLWLPNWTELSLLELSCPSVVLFIMSIVYYYIFCTFYRLFALICLSVHVAFLSILAHMTTSGFSLNYFLVFLHNIWTIFSIFVLFYCTDFTPCFALFCLLLCFQSNKQIISLSVFVFGIPTVFQM